MCCNKTKEEKDIRREKIIDLANLLYHLDTKDKIPGYRAGYGTIAEAVLEKYGMIEKMDAK